MKTIKILLIICCAGSFLDAANVTIQNINDDGNAAYALFDESGALIDGATSNNIRIGYFSGSFDPDLAWASGNLDSLNSNFVQFGTSSAGMAGINGVFQSEIVAASDSFSGEQITLWATNGAAFTDLSGQHLIYTFDTLTFQSDPWVGQVLLGTNSGSFLNESGIASGEFGNFSNDYDLGGGSLSGFNTVSPVPEPSTYALFAGILSIGYVVVRRARARA